MPKRVFFLDTSTIVHRYVTPKEDACSKLIRRRIDRLFTDAAEHPNSIVLQIPNICMAECAGAFARLCFEERIYGSGEKAKLAFWSLREALLKDVKTSRLVHSYELKRLHFIDIEDIFVRDHELAAPRGEKHLSSHDALILSMANEYRLAHSADRTKIVTDDRRIADFCRSAGDAFPEAVRISTQNPL
ncbi:MAG: hypothetical protein A2V88_13730 [Elusimicrobia bacterium RBG_16_66_12]|nr:MAG: hypothetical protein A2V88_13730 [Elusimicrobia bacterium RBG_16_66_12]